MATFDQLPSNVMAALQRGNKIEAIKLLREATGLGLKEAKEVIDHHAPGPVSLTAVVQSLSGLPSDVIDQWKKGNKVEAIKLLRAKGGAGLMEAKQAIEAAERRKGQSIETRVGNASSRLAPGEVPPSKVSALGVAILIALAALGYYLFLL